MAPLRGEIPNMLLPAPWQQWPWAWERMLSVVAALAAVANRFLMGAAHNGTAAWPRAPPRTNDEKQTRAHQVEIDLDHYRVLMPGRCRLVTALILQSRAEHVCIVITSGPVIKIDAGATPFLGNVLESWHGMEMVVLIQRCFLVGIIMQKM